jgi:hypothetical protein
MSRARARYTETDVRRIFTAAAKAGISVRVQIASDGTITVVTGPPGGEPSAANPWDRVLVGAEKQKRSA